MQTRKIISVGLLILIIVISLVFSEVMRPGSKESLAGLNILSPEDKNTINELLTKPIVPITDTRYTDGRDTYSKIREIYTYANKYTLLATIYNSISNNLINAVTKYIEVAPRLDSNGKKIDPDAISKSNIDKIKGVIINNNNKIPFEKIDMIQSIIFGNSKNNVHDRELQKLFDFHESEWVNVIQNYIKKFDLSGNPNAVVAKGYGDSKIDPMYLIR
uniref:Uncharacterized protein n=1 Tax=viral metagenome TaxID=1070528 RepID=A0A6C0D634_9ZZZZ